MGCQRWRSGSSPGDRNGSGTWNSGLPLIMVRWHSWPARMPQRLMMHEGIGDRTCKHQGTYYYGLPTSALR
jgi:hypothetical protein